MRSHDYNPYTSKCIMYRILGSEKSNIMGKEFQIGLIVIVIVLFISNVLTLQRVKELEELTITKTDNLEQNIGYFAEQDYISGAEVVRMFNDHFWFEHQNE